MNTITMAGFASFPHVGEPSTGSDFVRLMYSRMDRRLDLTAIALRAQGWEVKSLSLGSGRIGKPGQWRKITTTDVLQAISKWGAGRAFRHRGHGARKDE